ncbi:hypothetical protein BDV96DRAFT_640663 [Lophiotrema nucula]|uniref:DUF7730 domain-containing protein n=1 Tax=Lophiotrema nucula TaxID=690887 RepID=A0A6A5ZQX1_9PLEO|nr:hypothetical protein BDV96DRAFT_640663 [Lophiotrema nucula]
MKIYKHLVYPFQYIVKHGKRYIARQVKRFTYKPRLPLVAYSRQTSDRNPPAPLPSRRKRGLTATTSEGASWLLLLKLPPELREQIYCYVVGNRVLHIISSLVHSQTKPSWSIGAQSLEPRLVYRLDHETCKYSHVKDLHLNEQGRDAHSRCAIWINPNGELYFNAPQAVTQNEEIIETRFLRWWCRKGRVLNLLKTCRLIYSEAVHVLYTSNTFYFLSASTFKQFQSTLLPHRFASIRSFHLVLQCRYGVSERADKKRWHKSLEVLQNLKSLRRLVVIIMANCEEEYREKLLSRLSQIKVNGTFVVKVGWETEEWERDMEGKWPFKLIRD